MRKGKVYYKDVFAGNLTENTDGSFVFQYDNNYVEKYPNDFLSFSLKVRYQEYKSERLFPFRRW